MQSESPVLSANRLKLRAPRLTDLPPLYALAEDHKDSFLDDDHDFNLEYAQAILNDPQTIIIDDHDYAVGVLWFDETVKGLRSSIHILFRPRYWPLIKSQQTIAQALDLAFEQLGVERIYAYPLDHQKAALNLLKEHHFYSHKPLRGYAWVKGKKADLIFHELKRTSWEKHRGSIGR